MAWIAGASGAQATRRPEPRLLRSTFVALLGSRINLEADGARSVAQLEAVDDLRAGGTADDLAFGLLLLPLAGAAPSSQLHRLSSPGLRPVTLFLSPVGRHSGLRLQAIINQRIPR